MKKLVLLSVIFMLAFSCRAQDEGVAKFVVNPGHEYQVKVDNSSIWAKNYISLTSGQHDITIWSPGYYPLDTTVHISASDTTLLMAELRKRPEYIAFQHERASTVASINRKQSPLIIGTFTLAGFTTWRYFAMMKEYNQLEDFVSTYDRSDLTAIVQRARNDHRKVKDDFYTKRKTFRTFALATAGSAVLSYFVIKKTRKTPLPVYDDKYKIEFETLGFRPIKHSNELELFIGLTMRL